MATGKLISFTPLISNGVHETYTGQNGVMYKFTVVLLTDNVQISGVANSTKQQPSWKVGTDYTYDHVVNGSYSNIKSMKSVEQAGKPGGGSKPNPSFVIQKCFEASVECALLFFELNQEFYKDQATEDNLITAMYNHIIKGNEQRRWVNISSMRLALAKMKANGTFDKEAYKSLTAWLFATADAIANAMEHTVKEQLESDKANAVPA